MRYLLTCVLLLAIPQSAFALYQSADHPSKPGYKIVTCDSGARGLFSSSSNWRAGAHRFCSDAERRSSSSSSPTPSRQEPRRESSAPPSRQSQEPARASSASGSGRCSATELPIESQWETGKRLGTVSVPGSRPVTGAYLDVVCVEGEHRNNRERFQYRCGKDGRWQFVQRLWTKHECRDDGRISIR